MSIASEISGLIAQRKTLLDETRALANDDDINSNHGVAIKSGMKELETIDEKLKKLTEDFDTAETRQLKAHLQKSKGRVSVPDYEYASIDGKPTAPAGYFGRCLRSIIEGRNFTDEDRSINAKLAGTSISRPDSFRLPMNYETRDLTNKTSTVSAAGLSTQSYSPDFLGLLRASSILEKLGVPMISVPRGTHRIPRETSGSVAEFLSEGSGGTPSTVAVEYVQAVPRLMHASITFSRQLLKGSAYDVEQVLLGDLTSEMGRKLSQVFVSGNGLAEPTGFLTEPGIEYVSLATPNTFTYEDGLELTAALQSENGPENGIITAITSPAGSKVLRSTPVIGSSFPTFVQMNNQIDGHPIVVSTHIPSDLSESSVGSLTILALGYWADSCQVCFFDEPASYGSAEILIDPYSNAAAGEVTIHSFLDLDILWKRPSLVKIVSYK